MNQNSYMKSLREMGPLESVPSLILLVAALLNKKATETA